MAFDDGSLFGDYDVATAADDPFSIADGTYAGTITGFKKVSDVRSDGTPWSMIAVGLRADNGQTTDYRLFLPGPGDSEAQIARKRATMKAFLAGLEVPVEKMNTVREDDLIALRVIFTVKSGISKQGNPFKNFTFQRERGTSVATPANTNSAGLEEFVQAAGKDTAPDEFGL